MLKRSERARSMQAPKWRSHRTADKQEVAQKSNNSRSKAPRCDNVSSGGATRHARTPCWETCWPLATSTKASNSNTVAGKGGKVEGEIGGKACKQEMACAHHWAQVTRRLGCLHATACEVSTPTMRRRSNATPPRIARLTPMAEHVLEPPPAFVLDTT